MTESHTGLPHDLFLAVVCAAILAIAVQTFRSYGWAGILAKLSILVNGFFISIVIAANQMPWTALRQRHPHDDFRVLTYVGLAAFVLLCYFMLVLPNALRFVMSPAIRWVLYVSAALWICASIAARERIL